MKKVNLLFPILCLSVIGVSGCDLFKKENKEVVDENAEREQYAFKSILGEQDRRTIHSDETITVTLNKDLGEEYNYIRLFVLTNRNIKGKFIYSENFNPTNKVEEEFFIEGSTAIEPIEFRQFLDAFRPDNKAYQPSSKGIFDKTLNSIEFWNYGDEDLTFQLKSVEVSDRQIPEEDKEIYIEKDNLKVGADLLAGGTLTYLEKTQYEGETIDEIVNEKGNVEIGVGIAETGLDDISSHVNLINYYDAGRQIQQSFYAAVGGYGTSEADRKNASNPDGGEQNGYTRNWCETAGGYYWPYNPVQGGDENVNFSQLIDYKITGREIYVKVRACDWAASGRSEKLGKPSQNNITKSYMENWYTIKNGLLYSKNRFIDWNGFYDLEDVPAINIELPATYIVHPLHVYQAYMGNNPWTDDERQMDVSPNLGNWKYGSHQTRVHKEDWFAWTNDENFGVGMYIPGADYYASGRSETSTNADNVLNKNAGNSLMAGRYRYNKQSVTHTNQSCYVRNTDYTAPVKAVKMKEYIPFEYTYVVAVDYVTVFRDQFKDIYEAGEIDNSGMNNWEA